MSLLNRTKAIWRRRANLMTLIAHSRPSFSQYGEDVVLDKLLRPSNRGTYVDVGANHPIAGSNTFRLYLRGWTGLAIDPNPRFAKIFRKFRPEDCYLAEGVALKPMSLEYHAFDHDVFNTFDPDAVEKLLQEGVRLLSRTPVACRRLADIVEERLGDRHIDVLNVDCEGLDVDVLKSLDLTKYRPTVMIVEDYPRYMTFQASMPAMRLETFLRDAGYSPLAQAGWSGIYVANDWRELFLLSDAFHESRVRNGYLPGQASLSPTDR